MKKRAYEDACYRLMATGLAFTCVIVLPFLGTSLAINLVTEPSIKARFLSNCQERNELSACVNAWNEAQ